MKSVQRTPDAQAEELNAAKLFYFCYCLLGKDRVCAEKATRCVLAEFRRHAGMRETDKADTICFAALALEACAQVRAVSPETAAHLLYRVFRLSVPEISRLTGRSSEQVEHALQETEKTSGTGIPLLPLLEGECMVTCEKQQLCR